MDFVDRRRGTTVNLGSNPIAESIARQGGKPGPSTRAKNKRMAGTVRDMASGQAAVYAPTNQPKSQFGGTPTGAARDVLPRSAGRAFFSRIWGGADRG